ncbi:MAG: hypothetical protein D6816_02470 [Bacteroidetes bacterium]|nr:MAG: hypothetical protein D6816_02470 [Bacteroidota bacterium]
MGDLRSFFESGLTTPSCKDELNYSQALYRASNHESGGTYNMCATIAKNSSRVIGYNSLSELAFLKSDVYPEFCGIHAELDAFISATRSNLNIDNSTIYIAGTNSNKKELDTTVPCFACMRLITQLSRISWIVCNYNGDTIKFRSKHGFNLLNRCTYPDYEADWVKLAIFPQDQIAA